MQIEETKKCIEVMQAYIDGKKIECRELISNVFEEITNPIWDWDTFEYRVKPEPKIRPYNNAEECFADVKKHGGWVRNGNGDYILVSHINDRIYKDIAEHCTWVDDGSPCGIVES